jgi:hypothetical protein
MTVALLSGALISPIGLPAAGLAVTTLSVAPSSGLVDGQAVQVKVSGGTLGTTYVVADCDAKALLLLLEPGASPQDDCDSRHVELVTVGATGQAELTMDVPALLTTALGGADCRKVACFLAVYALHYLGGARLLVHSLLCTRGSRALSVLPTATGSRSGWSRQPRWVGSLSLCRAKSHA